jgi:ribonucleoside-triphosphate reductase
VRESIKTTTVKPSGTVSILAGESPGVHWAPGGEYFERGIVFQKDDPMVTLLPARRVRSTSAYTPETTVFVQFPIHSNARRSESEVSLFEKANLAVLAQRYWSDNSVSVTLSFDPATEGQHVGTVLHMHEGQLKTVSFLPRGNAVYAQMPYQESTVEAHQAAAERLFPLTSTPSTTATSQRSTPSVSSSAAPTPAR